MSHLTTYRTYSYPLSVPIHSFPPLFTLSCISITNMAVSIQDKINQQAIDSKNDMLWGKPAKDILNGRDMSA